MPRIELVRSQRFVLDGKAVNARQDRDGKWHHHDPEIADRLNAEHGPEQEQEPEPEQEPEQPAQKPTRKRREAEPEPEPEPETQPES
jgi:cell division septation protein DedD